MDENEARFLNLHLRPGGLHRRRPKPVKYDFMQVSSRYLRQIQLREAHTNESERLSKQRANQLAGLLNVHTSMIGEEAR